MTTQDDTVTPVEDVTPIEEGSLDDPAGDAREERLAEGADELVGARRSILAHPKFLLVASAILMSVGLTVILVGWAGAAHSTLIEEQVPYLISGGLFGLALAVIGALMLFAHWLTVALREGRAHEAARRADHAQLMGAIRDLTDALITQEKNNGSARGTGDQRPLRATHRGS